MKTLIRNLAVAAPLAFASLTLAPMPAFATDPVIVLPPSEPEPKPFDLANPEPEPVDPQGPDQVAHPKPGPVQPDGPDQIAPKPKPAKPDGPDTLANPEPGPVVDPGDPATDPGAPAEPPVEPAEPAEPIEPATDPDADPTQEPTTDPAPAGPDAEELAEGPSYEPVGTTTDLAEVDGIEAGDQQDSLVWFALAGVFAVLAGLVLVAWRLSRRRS